MLSEASNPAPLALLTEEIRRSSMPLARSLETLGRTDEAGRYFLALASKPASGWAHEARYRLGSLQYNQAEYASAVETFSAFQRKVSPSLSTNW